MSDGSLFVNLFIHDVTNLVLFSRKIFEQTEHQINNYELLESLGKVKGVVKKLASDINVSSLAPSLRIAEFGKCDSIFETVLTDKLEATESMSSIVFRYERRGTHCLGFLTS